MNETATPFAINIDDAHKSFALELFDLSLTHIRNPKLAAEDAERALQCAYASTLHWSYVGGAAAQARGEWLIAHVSIVLRRTEQALHHAKRCLDLTLENGLRDIDLASAYEGFARANALAGNREIALQYRSHAIEAGKEIEDQDDREGFWRDMSDGLWFGCRD